MVNIMKKSFVAAILTLVISLSMTTLLPLAEVNAAPCDPGKSFLGVPTWYKYLEGANDSTGRCSPVISDSASALPIGLAVLEGLLRVAGLVSVAMVFVGSYKYILSVGNPEKATSARKTIQNALIGLVIVIVSTGTVSFVGNRLTADPPTTFAPSGVS